MFSNWASPALAAIVAGGALWATLLAPLLLYQVRAYGGLSYRRVGGAAAVSIYGVALVAYTLLPTPGTDSWCGKDLAGSVETDFFHSIDDIQRMVELYGMPAALTTFTVLQVAMNVVLFIPWGILARRYFGMPFIVAVGSGALASVMIEATQYSGGWFLVGCQYRVADVDDVIANTLGAFIGAVLAPMLLFWMPPARKLSRARLDPRPVSGLRRAASVALDVAILWIVALLSYQVIALVSPVHGNDAAAASRHALALAIGGLVVLVPFVRGTRASWGERILWLRPVTRAVLAEDPRFAEDDPGGLPLSAGRGVVRGLVGLGVAAMLFAVAAAFEGAAAGTMQEVLVIAAYAFSAVLALWSAIDPRGGLPDLVVGATTVDSRAADHVDAEA